MTGSLPTVFIFRPCFILTQCCIRSLLHHGDVIRFAQAKAESCTLKLNTDKTVCVHVFVLLLKCCWMCVCRLQPIFEAAAKKGNNSVNRIQFLNTTAVVTVTMWRVRQQGGCVSSPMTKSVSSRDPKKIRMGSKAQLDLGSVFRKRIRGTRH